MSHLLAVILLVFHLALAGISAGPPIDAPVSIATGQTCFLRGPLPDRGCTPGATDPRVTQDNLQQTICVSGYTRTVRPPTSYTNPLKVEQLKNYGLTLTTAEVEEDHLIPLELGGAPRDPLNLWPEPRAGASSALSKDTVENRLHSLVCAGRMTLAEAQQRIATDWTTALR